MRFRRIVEVMAMFDFDPRDVDDSRDRNDRVWQPDRKWRDTVARSADGDGHDRTIDDHSSDVHERDERQRDDENGGPHLGRGPRSHDEKVESDRCIGNLQPCRSDCHGAHSAAAACYFVLRCQRTF